MEIVLWNYGKFFSQLSFSMKPTTNDEAKGEKKINKNDDTIFQIWFHHHDDSFYHCQRHRNYKYLYSRFEFEKK